MTSGRRLELDWRKVAPLTVSQASLSDLEMAGELVSLFERHADGWEEGEVPYFFGWALHRCFLLGLKIGREELAAARDKSPPQAEWGEWTEEEDAELMRLWPTHANNEIAALLGRGPYGVTKRRQRLGISR
jgi:hypothetical protein